MSCVKSAILTMAHTLDIHIKNINSLCRICGESTQTQKHKKDYKYPVPVEKFSKQLLFICSHQAISKIEKRSLSINNKCDRLKFILSTHLLGVSPLLCFTKEKKARKRKSN